MPTWVAVLTKLDRSLELFTMGLYLHFLWANQPCSFYMFSKLIFVCRAVSSFMSGAVVAGFYNTMYPSLVGANVPPPPNVSCTSNSCETLCSSCEEKEDRYARLIPKPCLIYGNFQTNINFIISSSSEPAQWSSSNNAQVGLRSCANGSNVSWSSDNAPSVCLSDRKYFLYWHWWFFVNRTDDIIKRLLSLELASHVSLFYRLPLFYLLFSWAIMRRQ